MCLSPQMWQLLCALCEEHGLGMAFEILHMHLLLGYGKNTSAWNKLYLSKFV